MEPLILSFKESPSKHSLDYSIIEYSDELNLSILKINGRPAVDYMNLGTTTFSKGSEEGTDTDKNKTISKLRDLTDTSTQTFDTREPSDIDYNYTQKLKMLLETSTLTEAVEGTDNDK